jgi:hypothetical protein
LNDDRAKGELRHGRPHGRWTYERADGSVAAEIDFDHGLPTRSVFYPRGRELVGAPVVRDADEVELWVELLDAWFEWMSGDDPSRGQAAVEEAIDAWPEEHRERPVA